MSFQMRVKPHRLAGAVFVTEVRDALLTMLMKRKREQKLKQADIAELLGVNRSVVNRQLTGKADLSLMRVGELADILGCTAEFRLVPLNTPDGNNTSDGKVSVVNFTNEALTHYGTEVSPAKVAPGSTRTSTSSRTSGGKSLVLVKVNMSPQYSPKTADANG